MALKNSHRRVARRNPEAKQPRPSSLRALLADIVESSNDAIYSRTLDGTVSSWNAAAEHIFGYRAEEIIGQSSAVLLPKERAGETPQLLQRIRRGLRVEHFETIRLRKDGTPLTVSLTLSPIRNERGRIVGASTIARDITMQRRLETEVVDISERERKRVGRDLHDGLGQQLGGIELVCCTLARSLAKRGLPETRVVKVIIKKIRETTAQTRALARGLAPVLDSPDGLMVALEDLTTTTLEVFGVRCAFHCEEPVLIADHAAAVHLFRIAQEAVTNAIRHGHTRRLELSLVRQGSKLALEIRDYGKGLGQPRSPGSGMGLRIMTYRAAALGGVLKLAPAQPSGALVRCLVPLSILEVPPA